MSARKGLVVLIAAATACRGPETSLAQIPRSIAVIPALTDLGDVPVGQTETFSLQITHLAGPDVDVGVIDVFNADGAWFQLVGEPPLVEDDTTVFVEFEYTPEVAGYHRAAITVLSDAERTPEIVVEARGHGDIPEIHQWPGQLDFGPVDPTDVVVRTVTLTNDSGLDFAVTGVSLSRPDLFELDTPLPVILPGGTEVSLDVSFQAADQAAVGAVLAFELNPFLSLPDVQLQANNCTTGDPDQFDADGDGRTSCGGDCDDGDPDEHPGAIETPDGSDDDCDQIVDEGTSNYDDDGDCSCEGSACLGSVDPGCATLEIGDCNDGDEAASPAATEVVDNGIDDDCDGVVDLGSTDADDDGYAPEGGDCNDGDASVRPGAPELADGLDNDCDTTRDEGTVRYDDDGDGYCEVTPCTDGSIAGDCDDMPGDGAATHPFATEVADGRDNNCDGTGPGGTSRVDEGTTAYDDDGDGFTEAGGDCADADPAVSPARIEIPGNGKDDDCDAGTPDT